MGSRWTNEKDEKLRIALYGTEINMIEDVGPSSLRERGRNKGKLSSSLLVFFFYAPCSVARARGFKKFRISYVELQISLTFEL